MSVGLSEGETRHRRFRSISALFGESLCFSVHKFISLLAAEAPAARANDHYRESSDLLNILDFHAMAFETHQILALNEFT